MTWEQNKPKFDSICLSFQEEKVWPVRAVLRNFTTLNLELLYNAIRSFDQNWQAHVK